MDVVFREYFLKDVCKIHKGISFKGIHYLEKGTPVLKSVNIYGGKIIKDNLSYFDESNFKKLDSCRVRHKDVVITGLGPPGKVGINLTDIEFVLGGEVFKLEPDPKILNREYLYYFLMNSPMQVEQMKTFANIVRIRMPALEKFRIKVPDLETQRRIVRQLDKFQELKEELKEELMLRKRQGVYYRNKIMEGLKEFVASRE